MMRRMMLMGVLLVLGLTGCSAIAPAAPPTVTPIPLPPTATPTQGPTPYIPPTPTPGLPLRGGLLIPGEPFESALLPEVPARFTFEGERYRTYTTSVTPQDASLDLKLSLLDPTNTALFTVDRAPAGQAEVLPEFTLPLSGGYTLLVEAVSGAGDVAGQMTLIVLEEQHGGGRLDPLDGAEETTAEGVFFAPDVFHAYTLELNAGDVVYFEVLAAAEGVDPYFTLYDDSYNIVGRYDDENGVNALTSDMYIPFDGVYTLFVGDKGVPGAYTVRVATE